MELGGKTVEPVSGVGLWARPCVIGDPIQILLVGRVASWVAWEGPHKLSDVRCVHAAVSYP